MLLRDVESHLRFSHSTLCRLVLLLALSPWLTASGACRPATDTPSTVDVVTTTTMLADLATQLAGDDLQVRSIMHPGGDPHLYQPTPSDARLIASARVVLVSGLGLEGWIEDLVRNAGGDATIIVVGEVVEPIRHPEYPDGTDPHFWFDPTAWSAASIAVEDALVAVVDEAAQPTLRARGSAYRETLSSLDTWTQAQLNTVPEAQRHLVTSHDAFNYFARRYDLRVSGLQGITTETQPSQREIADLIDMIRDTGVRSVFVETSVNPTLSERVASEAGVGTSGPLYSDSLGAADGPAATYLGTFTENVRMIVEGLGGSYTPFVP
jgi:ABC-type Zn uptake system ZnuABC Zn-binding protein ZnuA